MGAEGESGLTTIGAGTFAKRDSKPPLSLGRLTLLTYSTIVFTDSDCPLPPVRNGIGRVVVGMAIGDRSNE